MLLIGVIIIFKSLLQMESLWLSLAVKVLVLDLPRGIIIDTAGTGLVYVSEGGNDRISVFTSDGVFVSSFGRKGSTIDQFKLPLGLRFDKKGFSMFVMVIMTD